MPTKITPLRLKPDNPAALRDPHFQFFDLETFPWLHDHYASIRSARVPVLDKLNTAALKHLGVKG